MEDVAAAWAAVEGGEVPVVGFASNGMRPAEAADEGRCRVGREVVIVGAAVAGCGALAGDGVEQGSRGFCDLEELASDPRASMS